MSEISIGIDPGKTGGIAWNVNGHVTAWKMQDTERDTFDLLSRIESLGECFCYLERVASSPQMGVVSAFTFGKGYGGLRMALVAVGIPFETVTPAKWQGNMQCRSKGDKNVTKRRAQELFPNIKVTHAIADSLLICEYGRRLRSKGTA